MDDNKPRGEFNVNIKENTDINEEFSDEGSAEGFSDEEEAQGFQREDMRKTIRSKYSWGM